MTLFSTIATLLAILSSPGAVRAVFSVETPVFVQCQIAHISWNPTVGPYDLLIANQSNQCGYAVADIGLVVNSSVDWKVNLPGGWTVAISVEDALKDDCWSEPITVQPSNDFSCLSPGLAAIASQDDAEYSSTHTPTPTTTSQGPTGAKASAGLTSGVRNAAASFHRRAPPLPAVLVGAASVAVSAFFVLQISTA